MRGRTARENSNRLKKINTLHDLTHEELNYIPSFLRLPDKSKEDPSSTSQTDLTKQKWCTACNVYGGQSASCRPQWPDPEISRAFEVSLRPIQEGVICKNKLTNAARFMMGILMYVQARYSRLLMPNCSTIGFHAVYLVFDRLLTQSV